MKFSATVCHGHPWLPKGIIRYIFCCRSRFNYHISYQQILTDSSRYQQIPTDMAEDLLILIDTDWYWLILIFVASRLKFGTDLTQAAREGRLDPLVGRGTQGTERNRNWSLIFTDIHWLYLIILIRYTMIYWYILIDTDRYWYLEAWHILKVCFW